MTTRGEINSNFYQIVNVDANGAPTSVKPEYLGNISNVNYANNANYANFAGQANTANVANSVAVANVSGLGNIATINLTGSTTNVLYGNGTFAAIPSVSNVANANYANFAGTAYSVSGSNVTGTVANATYAVSAGSATVAASANSVAVANVSGIGNIATVNLTGSTTNVLYGNGTFAAIPSVSNVANANYANFAGTAYSVSGSNVTGYVANATHANVSDSANSVSAANIVGTVNLANYATVANSVAGSNVSGQVANANYSNYSNVANTANSVSVANVSGIGNIATVNLDGNVSNVLSGNGTWISTGTAVNANYANYAGNVTVSSQPNITSVGNLVNLQFNNTVTPITAATGQMFWDTNEHTVSLGMENGVTQQIGLESYVYVKASSAITDGQVVMFTGANGNNVEAAPANASSVGFKADYIIGIATQDIATNGFGYITVFGMVHGLNTNSYNVGDILWYDPTSTTGGLTNVQPTDPAFQIQMAAVTKKSAGDGHIQVRVSITPALNLLTDVTITTPTTGQALVYNGSNVWVNGIPNIANIAYSVSGANVSGTVANANFASYSNVSNSANSVAVANVSGIGNIATVNLTGSTSNVLYGNGAFAAIPTVSNVANANYANFAGTAYSVAAGNIVGIVNLANFATTANAVAGANVSGTVANAAYALNAGNATVAASANSVAVANVSGIGNIATVNLTGSTSNVLYGNGVFAAIPTVSNVANANYSNFAGTAFSVSASNISGTVNLANFATTANSVAGANVSGTVANATYALNAGNATVAASANSVAVANVSGIGNIATINLDGNVSNVLSGNGSFVALPTVSANANYANYAGNAFSVDAGNIVGTVNLANYATVANSVAGSNVSGIVANANFASYANVSNSANSVAVANVSGIGNIATINLNGSSSNVLYGNGVWAAVSATSANFANYAGNVTVAAQANITSVGTLTTLNVSGNVTASRLISNVATGTAPLTVTSTTLVPNLYVEKSNTITYVSDTSTNASFPMAFIGTSSNTIRTDTGASYNPQTGNLTIFGVVGRFFGAANTVTTAAQPNITSLTASSIQIGNSTANAVFANGVVTTTGNITAPFFVGNGSALTGITAANATAANTLLSNTATTATVYPTFVTSVANGYQSLQKVTGITANLAANSFSATLLGGTLTTAAQPNITSLGTLTGLSVAGNISAQNMSAITGNISALNISAITNITAPTFVSNISTGTAPFTVTSTTQVANLNVARAGTADSVAVANVSGIGNIATVNLNGNGSQYLAGNGTWNSVSATPAGSLNEIQFNGGGVFGANAGFTYDGLTGAMTVQSGLDYSTVGPTSITLSGNVNTTSGVFIGNGNSLSSLQASNIVGTVANANFASYSNVSNSANSVAVANVSGIGNIATINLDGNASNLLYGNGAFAPISITSVANANYANFAGTAYSVDAANISGTVNLANYATTANAVAVANVSGIGNIATINLDGNASNLLYGNGAFAPISITSVANANYANFAGTVLTNAQPNITSTGTLTSLTVSGAFTATAGFSNIANVSLTKYTETTVAGGNTSSSIAPNFASGTIYAYTANASFSFNGFTSPVSGQSGTVIITQDATGGRTMTSTMKFAGGSKTLSTAANAIDIISVVYDGTTYYAVLTKAFA